MSLCLALSSPFLLAAEARTGDSFEIAPVTSTLSYTYSWKYNESGVKTATLNAFSVSDAQMTIGRTYRVTFRLTGPDLSPNVVGTGSCNIHGMSFISPSGQSYTERSFDYKCDSIGDWKIKLDVNGSGTNQLLGYMVIYKISNLSMTVTDVTPRTVEEQLDGINDSINDQIAQESQQHQEQMSQAEEQHEETKGFLGRIIDGILSIPGKIIELLINALKSLFVPEDGYFSDYFDRLNTFFSDRLGLLYEPIDIAVTFINGLLGAGVGTASIPIPALTWEGQTIWDAQTFTFDFLSNPAFLALQQKLYFVTDVMMVGALLNLIHRKSEEVMLN